MFKKSLLSVAVIAASVASVSAFAADKALPQQKVNVGVNAALAGISNPWQDYVKTAGNYSYKSYGFGYGVDAGYAYQIMPNFYLGADLGYQDNGKSTATEGADEAIKFKVKSKMVTFLVTADYFINNNWDVFGKFGPAYVMQSVTYWNSPNIKTNKVRPLISIGGGYTFDNNVYVNASYDHLFGTTSKDDGGLPVDSEGRAKIRTVNTLKLTVGYNFPI